MKSIYAVISAVTILALFACSGESGNENAPSGEHIFKEQTDALDKARQVEKVMLDSAAEQKKNIEEQTQ